MKKLKNFLISVIPLVRIPPSHETTFSYIFNSSIPFGSLVEIPFGESRIIQGIVIDSRNTENSEGFKSIKKILFSSLLNANHVLFARHIAKEYFVSIGTILTAFLPPKGKFTKTKAPIQNTPIKNIRLTPQQKQASKKILQSKKAVLLTGPPSSGKTEVLIDIAKDVIQKKYQVLFLLPEITLTAHTLERITRRLGKDAFSVYHSNLTQRQRRITWQRIANGDPCVVVGSRSALFLPFQRLGLIIVDEEHDDSYKQTLKSPRYDARILVKKLASLHQSKLLLCSSTPRSETLFQISKKEINLVRLPLFFHQRKKVSPQIQIIDMRLAHWKHKQKRIDPPLFSEELLTSLRDTLTKKRQSLLLVSHQGMNAFSLCVTCKNIFRCPKCDRALVPQRSGHFLCLNGHFRTQSFPKCPTCGNLQFIGHGVGTQKVEEQLIRLFPSARIARLDSQSSKKQSLQNSIISAMSKGKVDILIGTQMVGKGWDIPQLSFIGIIDSDSFLSFPDYSIDARIAQLFFQALGRLNRIGSTSPGTFLAQTYHPERSLFSFLKKNDYIGFIQEEMKTRYLLKYPPYCRLLLLVGKGVNEIKLREQSLLLYAKLTQIKDTHFTIMRPSKSLKRQKVGYFSRQIIIKNFSKTIPPSLSSLLENLPRNWYIDNDALSLN